MRITNINDTNFNAKFKIDHNGNLQKLWENANKDNFSSYVANNFAEFKNHLPNHELEITKICNSISSNSTKIVECFNNSTGGSTSIILDEKRSLPLIEQLVVALNDFFKQGNYTSNKFWCENNKNVELFREITGQ